MTNHVDNHILDLYAATFQEDNYPPVAGKILGLFYVSEQKYFSFEELQNQLEISKSAVSKALKMLLNIGEINFVTFEDNKRKRYFYLDVQGNIDRIQSLITSYIMQTKLLEETLALREETNPELNNFIKNSIKFNREVIAFVDQKVKEHY